MKQLLLALVILVSGFPAWSHVITGGEGFSGNTTATLVIDFSETTVNNQPLSEFLSDRSLVDEFEDYISDYYADFIERFTRRCEKLNLTRTPGKPLTLTIKVKTVNTKGNEATCEYIFTDTESGKMLLTVTERTREGRIGSFPNLLGDVIREAGGDFGKFMKRYLKDKKDIDDPLYI